MPSLIRPKYNLKGRPLNAADRITELQRAQFLDKFADTFNEAEARRRSGISAVDLLRLRHDCPDFKAAYEAIRQQCLEERLDRVEDTVYTTALKGDVSAGKFLLSKRRRETYGDRPQVVLNLTPADFQGKSLEELRELRDRLAKAR